MRNPASISVDLGDHDGLSMTWYNVTVPAGTQVMLSLLDSSDEEGWTGAVSYKFSGAIRESVLEIC